MLVASISTNEPYLRMVLREHVRDPDELEERLVRALVRARAVALSKVQVRLREAFGLEFSRALYIDPVSGEKLMEAEPDVNKIAELSLDNSISVLFKLISSQSDDTLRYVELEVYDLKTRELRGDIEIVFHLMGREHVRKVIESFLNSLSNDLLKRYEIELSDDKIDVYPVSGIVAGCETRLEMLRRIDSSPPSRRPTCC